MNTAYAVHPAAAPSIVATLNSRPKVYDVVRMLHRESSLNLVALGADEHGRVTVGTHTGIPMLLVSQRNGTMPRRSSTPRTTIAVNAILNPFQPGTLMSLRPIAESDKPAYLKRCMHKDHVFERAALMVEDKYLNRWVAYAVIHGAKKYVRQKFLSRSIDVNTPEIKDEVAAWLVRFYAGMCSKADMPQSVLDTMEDHVSNEIKLADFKAAIAEESRSIFGREKWLIAVSSTGVCLTGIDTSGIIPHMRRFVSTGDTFSVNQEDHESMVKVTHRSFWTHRVDAIPEGPVRQSVLASLALVKMHRSAVAPTTAYADAEQLVSTSRRWDEVNYSDDAGWMDTCTDDDSGRSTTFLLIDKV